jgi:hypothetical protein
MPTNKVKDIIQYYREIAVCDSLLSKQAHQSLYHLADEAYITLSDQSSFFAAMKSLVTECADNACCIDFHLHMVLQWQSLLQVALWRETPAWSDVFFLLKDAGVSVAEMQPFCDSALDDLFPWLYYGKRMDVLRRLCLRAKRKLDDILSLHDIRVLCHVIGDAPPHIVASSL